MALVVCSVCRRHVKRTDSVCPFCGAAMPTGFRPGLGGALVLGMGLAVTSCGEPNPAPAYTPAVFTGGTAGGGHTDSLGGAGTSGGWGSGGAASGGA